ncbi:putative reverse transcriptase domain-containing protein [Tanacetum coccineum]
MGYRAAMIRLRAEAASTSHSLPLPSPFILSPTRSDAPSSGIPPPLPISLPTSSPPLLIPSASRKEDRPEVTLPPWKRLGIALGTRYEVGESSSAAARPARGLKVDYDFVATMDREIRRQAVTSEMLKADHRRSVKIRELRTADHTRQQQLIQTLTVLYFLVIEENGTKTSHKAMIDQGVTAALAARDANRNGDDSHTSGTGTEGVVELTQWFERMETIFRISNCFVENQIKFSTCTLLAGALTWWNSHVLTVNHDVAYAMTWADLRKKMTDRMFPEESDKIERYVGGLPDMIHGNIVASKPKTIQEAIEMATELMDKKVITITERQAKNKRKFENTSRNNQNQQQQNKRQNTGRAYTAGTGEKKSHGGSKTLCVKCNYHHDCPCAPKCLKCNKFGHFASDCRSAGNANNTNNQRGTGSGQKSTCFEYGVQGHFKRECPKLKNNKNRGNQVGNDKAPKWISSHLP